MRFCPHPRPSSLKVDWPSLLGKRPLIPITCAYLFGLILGLYVSYLPLGVGIALLVALAWTLRWGGWMLPALLRGAIVLLVTFAGLIYVQIPRVPPRSDPVWRVIGEGRVKAVLVEGLVDAPPQVYADRVVLTVALRRLADDEGGWFPSHARIRLTQYASSTLQVGPQLAYGDRFEGVVRLRRARGFFNPGGFRYGEYLAAQGIVAVGRVERGQAFHLVGRGGNRLLAWLYHGRERIRALFSSSLSPPVSAILQAMIIGNQGELTPEIREQFMASGTTHILSISGSHLGLVAFLTFTLLRWLLFYLPDGSFLRLTQYVTVSRLAAMATVPPVVFYTLLSGAEVPTLRSLIMILIYLLAVLVERGDHLLNALAVAALIVLVANPLAITDISFQLSYLSVLAIVLTLKGMRGQDPLPEQPHDATGSIQRRYGGGGWWGKLLRHLVLYAAITVGATLVTAPLVALYFRQLSWVGLLANLLIVPFAGFVVVPLGLFSAALILVFSPSALPLAGLNEIMVSFFYRLVHLFAAIPYAEVHLPAPPLLAILAYFLLLWALLWPGVRGRPRLVAVLLAAILCIPFALAQFPRRWTGAGEAIRVTYLDVGQGDATVIEFPSGQVMVIDGGGARGGFDLGRLVVAPYLWDRGIRRIDYLVSSHPQLDHLGGLPFLLRKFPVGEIWKNSVERDWPLYQSFLRWASVRRVPVRIVGEGGYALLLGKTRVEVLQPPDWSGRARLGDNDSSLVVKVTHQGDSFLFPGDVEQAGQRALLPLGQGLRSRILKVPHHGARSSYLEEFLHQVRPEIAVISVGEANPYGHPAGEVLESYAALAGGLYRTDRDGLVEIRGHGAQLRVRRYWDLVPQRVTGWPLGRHQLAIQWFNVRRIFLNH